MLGYILLGWMELFISEPHTIHLWILEVQNNKIPYLKHHNDYQLLFLVVCGLWTERLFGQIVSQNIKKKTETDPELKMTKKEDLDCMDNSKFQKPLIYCIKDASPLEYQT